MSVITFKAHYDGKQICLDEPIHLAPNTPLIVTVLPADALETERSEWLAASQAAFARAYGEDEPDYSDALIRERPPKKMKEGDVILAPLPQVDGQRKNRPAIVLRIMPPFGDFLVCGISSQLHQQTMGFDEIISPPDADFTTSGLRAASLVRLGFLSLFSQNQIPGSIGEISSERHQRLLKRLAEYLVSTQSRP